MNTTEPTATTTPADLNRRWNNLLISSPGPNLWNMYVIAAQIPELRQRAIDFVLASPEEGKIRTCITMLGGLPPEDCERLWQAVVAAISAARSMDTTEQVKHLLLDCPNYRLRAWELFHDRADRSTLGLLIARDTQLRDAAWERLKRREHGPNNNITIHLPHLNTAQQEEAWAMICRAGSRGNPSSSDAMSAFHKGPGIRHLAFAALLDDTFPFLYLPEIVVADYGFREQAWVEILRLDAHPRHLEQPLVEDVLVEVIKHKGCLPALQQRAFAELLQHDPWRQPRHPKDDRKDWTIMENLFVDVPAMRPQVWGHLRPRASIMKLMMVMRVEASLIEEAFAELLTRGPTADDLLSDYILQSSYREKAIDAALELDLTAIQLVRVFLLGKHCQLRTARLLASHSDAQAQMIKAINIKDADKDARALIGRALLELPGEIDTQTLDLIAELDPSLKPTAARRRKPSTTDALAALLGT